MQSFPVCGFDLGLPGLGAIDLNANSPSFFGPGFFSPSFALGGFCVSFFLVATSSVLRVMKSSSFFVFFFRHCF